LMVAYAVGLFSKENAVVLPAVVLLYELAVHRRVRDWVGYVVLLPPLLAWWTARQMVFAHNPVFHLAAADYIDNALLKGDAWTARLTAVKIIGKYLWLLVWPRTLSADYAYNQIPLAHWQDAALIATAAAIVAILAAAIWLWRRQPVVSFCLLFFFVALAPVSNIFFLCSSTMAERFLYLPSVAFAGLAGWAVAGAFERAPRLAGVVAGMLALTFGARTYVRNEDWRDPLTFWVQLVNTSPESYRGHAGLAAAIINHDPEHQYTDAAVASVRRALAITPDAVSVQVTAGQVYRTKGDTTTARDPGGEMLQTPASDDWYQQSLAALQKAARLAADPSAQKPGQASAAININESTINDEMGQTWMRLGNLSAAVEAFRQARRANPTREAYFLRLGDALVAAGQPAEAARCYWQALFIATDHAPARRALTAVYAQLPDRHCPELNASCPLIRQDICAAHAEMAQLLIEAGLHAAAKEVREHAVHDYGCPP